MRSCRWGPSWRRQPRGDHGPNNNTYTESIKRSPSRYPRSQPTSKIFTQWNCTSRTMNHAGHQRPAFEHMPQSRHRNTLYKHKKGPRGPATTLDCKRKSRQRIASKKQNSTRSRTNNATQNGIQLAQRRAAHYSNVQLAFESHTCNLEWLRQSPG